MEELNKEIVLKWFEKYPKLETFIGAGTISLKMAREILDVDRYFMAQAVDQNAIFKQ